MNQAQVDRSASNTHTHTHTLSHPLPIFRAHSGTEMRNTQAHARRRPVGALIFCAALSDILLPQNSKMDFASLFVLSLSVDTWRALSAVRRVLRIICICDESHHRNFKHVSPRDLCTERSYEKPTGDLSCDCFSKFLAEMDLKAPSDASSVFVTSLPLKKAQSSIGAPVVLWTTGPLV